MNNAETKLLDLATTALRDGRSLGRKVRLPWRIALDERVRSMAATVSVTTSSISEATAPGAEKSRVLLDSWEILEEEARKCVQCRHLAATRTQVVFGVGRRDADLLFVGEAPGVDEDREGEPFVDRAGQLLTKVIETMGMKREGIFLTNVLKCRPDTKAGDSGNRTPTPLEMTTCLPYLQRQIALVQPRVIVALGATALHGLTGKATPIGASRGKWLDYGGIPMRATFHPAYILRNDTLQTKRAWWEDMLTVLEKLGIPISDKQQRFFQPK